MEILGFTSVAAVIIVIIVSVGLFFAPLAIWGHLSKINAKMDTQNKLLERLVNNTANYLDEKQ